MPFRKRKQMSSSERTKILSSKAMTKTINSKPIKASNFNNGFFDKTMSHSDLLKYTKGYFHYKCCCNSQKSIVNSANQGKYSYIDLTDVVKMKYFEKHCKFKDYQYIIDECRHKKGLITPIGKLNPKPQEKPFSYPTPIKKLYYCCELKQYSCGPCDTHCNNKWHSHYFPSNSQTIHYEHKHSITPHPDPHPFPSNETNFMSKYNLDKSLIGK